MSNSTMKLKLPTTESAIREYIEVNWDVAIDTPYGEPLQEIRKSMKEAFGCDTLLDANEHAIDFIVDYWVEVNYELEEIPASVREKWKGILVMMLEEKVRAKWKVLNRKPAWKQ